MLRSDTQGRLLARLLTDPAQEFNLSELVTWTDSSMPTIKREVDRAERAGILTTRKVGPTRLVRANTRHPLHAAVRQLVLGTYGPPAIVSREFANIDGVLAVALFGSWAARYLGDEGRAPNDVDVLVIGFPDHDAIDDAAERAERHVGLPVQATIRSRAQWLSSRESFIKEVKARPLVVVLLDDDDTDLAGDLRDRAGAAESQP
jgi:hypothetical protein